MSRKDLRSYISMVVVILVLIGLGALAGHYAPKQEQSSRAAGAEISTPTSIVYSGVNGKNAFELLKAKHDVQYQETSAGIFVTSIDSRANTDTSFWLYYINGKPGTVASDQYKTKSNDKVEWRYESIQ